MTTYNVNTTQQAGLAAQPFQLPSADKGYGGKSYKFMTSYTYNSDLVTTVIKGPTIPAGFIFESVTLLTDTSTGSTTLAVGDGTTANKFKAAAAITAVGVPQISNLVPVDPPAVLSAPLTLYVTTAAATGPASGNLWIIANCVGI